MLMTRLRTRFRTGVAITLLMAFVVGIGACVDLKQPRVRTLYYTLEYEPPDVMRSDPLPVSIGLDRFNVAPIYNSRNIVYRDASFERGAYPLSKWRANPGDLVTYFLARDMRQSGLFKAVFPDARRQPSSYLVEGSVDEFLEWSSEASWKAVLTLSVTVTAENEPDISKRIVFQKTYSAEEPCRQKDPKSLAEAMSKALAVVSARITRDIYDHLKEEP